MNKYITVLDFEIGRIFQYKIDENDIPIGITIHDYEAMTQKILEGVSFNSPHKGVILLNG